MPVAGEAMQVAIMIPMTDAAASDAEAMYPKDWPPDGEWSRIVWPEMDGGVPMLQEDIARYLQEAIERDAAHGVERMLIVTRSEVAFHRVRRMVIEGADIEVAVYLVDDTGQERLDVNRQGMLPHWPAGLFGHTASECGAILRGQMAARKARSSG